MTRLLLALLALLVLAPPAHADGRFARAFTADSAIHSTGNGFAWTTRDGRVRVTDARGRTLYDVQPAASCHAPSASPGVVLIACGAAGDAAIRDVWLLDTRTGELSTRPVAGEPGRIGRWWIESTYDPAMTPHGASLVFTNWHTGAQRTGSALPDAPRRDLDDPALGVAERPYRRRGRALLVRRGDAWREFARCRVECRDVLVWRRRAAYLDGRQLVERRPRHTTRWRVPAAARAATLHRARNALVLQRGAQVWRAVR